MNFQERRRIVEQWVCELVEQEKQAREEREVWESVLHQLDDPNTSPEQSNLPVVTPGARRESGRNAQLIQTVLEDRGTSQAANLIAGPLHRAGLITSSRGYSGVYAIVSTVLRRNPGKRFVQLDNGWWDLSKRQQSPEQQAPRAQDNEPSSNGRPDSDFTPDKIGVPVNLKGIGRN